MRTGLAIFALAFALVFWGKAKSTEVEYVGHAEIIDGDTIRIGRTKVRLYGIDAPELGQQCQPFPSKPFDCGYLAGQGLAELTGGAIVTCTQITTDMYRRVVATCITEGGVDLNEEMVRNGLAIAAWYRRGPRRPQDDRYERLQAEAVSRNYGIWATVFDTPESWRRMHPRKK